MDIYIEYVTSYIVCAHMDYNTVIITGLSYNEKLWLVYFDEISYLLYKMWQC